MRASSSGGSRLDNPAGGGGGSCAPAPVGIEIFELSLSSLPLVRTSSDVLQTSSDVLSSTCADESVGAPGERGGAGGGRAEKKSESSTTTTTASPLPPQEPQRQSTAPSTEPPDFDALILELVRRGELPQLSLSVVYVLRKMGDHGAPAFEIAKKLGDDAVPGEIRACLETMTRYGLVRNRGRDPKEPYDGDHWILCVERWTA